MKDKVVGHLQIGATNRGEVVMNYEIDILRDLDSQNTGHFTFSPNQARGLALSLFRQARIAVCPKWPHHDDVPKATADDIFSMFSGAIARIRECLENGDRDGITEAADSVKFEDVENLIRAVTTRKGIAEDGERIPPIQGDPPCDEYDPAGAGAGLEFDGQPQCASCGWPRTFHELPVALAQLIKLQAHYAELLNMHDGGKRTRFHSPEEWISRLRETGALPKLS